MLVTICRLVLLVLLIKPIAGHRGKDSSHADSSCTFKLASHCKDVAQVSVACFF